MSTHSVFCVQGKQTFVDSQASTYCELAAFDFFLRHSICHATSTAANTVQRSMGLLALL